MDTITPRPSLKGGNGKQQQGCLELPPESEGVRVFGRMECARGREDGREDRPARPDPKPLTQRQRIMLLLIDGEWHHMKQLQAICWRYSARLWDLKQGGFMHEVKRDSAGAFWYRHVKGT